MNFESGYMTLPDNEGEPKSSEQEKIRQAEHLADRIINNEQNSSDTVENESGNLESHVQDLLDLIVKSQSPDSSKICEEAERVILKVFKNAEYTDSDQLDKPPMYREYKDQYRGSMGKIYSFLALQTLASSGRATKNYESINLLTDKSVMGSSVISALKRRDNKEVPKEQAQAANRFLEKMLEEYGVSVENIIDAWKLSAYGENNDKVAVGAMQNIEAMRFLEKNHPGSVNALNGQFGMKHFGRYPEKALIKQYEERDDCDKPYGVMFSAIADHNGVFRTGLWSDTNNLQKDLGDKYLLRIFEVDRKFGIGRRLVECDDRYGENNKISFAKFNGHGEKDKILFGKGNESVWGFISNMLSKKGDSTSVSSKDLDGRGFRRAKKFFTESPYFVYASCGAGEEGGIVQKSSEVYQGEALGQDYVGSSFPVRPDFDEKGVLTGFSTRNKEWEKAAGRYHKGQRISR